MREDTTPEQQAIIDLAILVSTVAHRCWEALGTAEVERIGNKCADIVQAMENMENL